MASNYYQSGPSSGKTIEATVKWFNVTKGFGFISPKDGSEDVFLHASALEAAGLGAPSEGATIKCEVGPGKKGPQVTRILELSGNTSPLGARPPRMGGGDRDFGGGGGGGRRDSGGGGGGGGFHDDSGSMVGAMEVRGTVKWYSPEKGYGFVAAGDGGSDVFVHSNVVRRSGLQTLMPEQPVTLMVVTTQKGREARSVRTN
jgi:cold shock protein